MRTIHNPIKRDLRYKGFTAHYDRDRGEYLVIKGDGPGYFAVVGNVSEFRELVNRITRKNPGAAWHVERGKELRETRRRYLGKPGGMWDMYNSKVLENDFAADASVRQGIRNPICYDCGKKISYDEAEAVQEHGKTKFICRKCANHYLALAGYKNPTWSEMTKRQQMLYSALYEGNMVSSVFSDREKLAEVHKMVSDGLLVPAKRGPSPFHDNFSLTSKGKKEALIIKKHVEKNPVAGYKNPNKQGHRTKTERVGDVLSGGSMLMIAALIGVVIWARRRTP